MRCIITGSRSITSMDALEQAIAESGIAFDEIVSGGASGVDTLAFLYARSNGIPFSEFRANWSMDGKSAGMMRNQEMLKYASKDPLGCALILLWDGVSRGSANIRQLAIDAGIKIHEAVIPAGRGLIISSSEVGE